MPDISQAGIAYAPNTANSREPTLCDSLDRLSTLSKRFTDLIIRANAIGYTLRPRPETPPSGLATDKPSPVPASIVHGLSHWLYDLEQQAARLETALLHISSTLGEKNALGS
jgi:hypothetical protein